MKIININKLQSTFHFMFRGKNAIIKNLNDNQYKAPIIFLTNRPWNIECDGLLQHINYAIEIPLFDEEQRK
jgi:hypothetical protein